MAYVHDYKREKRNAYLRSIGQPVMVDPQPARERLTRLHDVHGASWQTIVDATPGVGFGTIIAIASGQRKTIRRATHDAIMAANPPRPAHVDQGALLDVAGTRRRLQALVAQGFPLIWQATQIPTRPETLSKIVSADSSNALVKCYAGLSIRVAEMFDKLQDANPEDFGIPTWQKTRAVSYGSRMGWLRGIYWDWDQIDDPNGFPDLTGMCGTPHGAQFHRRHSILPVCQACHDAYNDYNEARKERARAEGRKVT